MYPPYQEKDKVLYRERIFFSRKRQKGNMAEIKISGDERFIP
jgi:hypothetical protein